MKQTSTQSLSEEEKFEMVIENWIRISNIKLGWIHDFNKLVVNYATTFFMVDSFCLKAKLLKTLNGHTNKVYSIDYYNNLICSGSNDKTVRVWDLEKNEEIKRSTQHAEYITCVKFSLYDYNNNKRNVICSCSDEIIRFWDFKNNEQFRTLNEHTGAVCAIDLSSFNNGKYLCSGSGDRTIRLWNIETSKSLHIFNGHNGVVWCIDFSPLQSNTDNNNVGIIGGNGYTICSGSFDKTIRIWDIETTKKLITFKGHQCWVRSVKYGINELRNTILSGSNDNTIRLWDIRSGKQIQIFNEHKDAVMIAKYSPFIINNDDNNVNNVSNILCSGSLDNTIRFWDIRSNKEELYTIKDCDGIYCLKFLQFKYKNYGVHLCYGTLKGFIRIWG
ncbi:WD-40 repeat-containing protein [Reticulomyxa filosa]|uniref:WD-40 repeat-containing protein n=1 Tax=Reticulomyxa filosa TaxID=46433 RepID=X6MA42_RETFI|nr:WD-40 repeat-containing protein [Reticulomyxa filosa]|eukprot:ETO09860.1 WD-40 repeat-containing protein [Reticulomyxa filosa]